MTDDGKSGKRHNGVSVSGNGQKLATSDGGLRGGIAVPQHSEEVGQLVALRREIKDLRNVIGRAKAKKKSGSRAKLRSQTETLLHELESVWAEVSTLKGDKLRSRAVEIFDMMRQAREIIRTLETARSNGKNGLAGSYGYQYRANLTELRSSREEKRWKVFKASARRRLPPQTNKQKSKTLSCSLDCRLARNSYSAALRLMPSFRKSITKLDCLTPNRVL